MKLEMIPPSSTPTKNPTRTSTSAGGISNERKTLEQIREQRSNITSPTSVLPTTIPATRNKKKLSVTKSTSKKTNVVDLISSNVIGSRIIISTPFGEKEIVYADYTASGRSLQFIEDYMVQVVSPLYANTHTEASTTGAQTTHFREEARDIIRNATNAPSDEYTVLFTGSGSTGKSPLAHPHIAITIESKDFRNM